MLRKKLLCIVTFISVFAVMTVHSYADNGFGAAINLFGSSSRHEMLDRLSKSLVDQRFEDSQSILKEYYRSDFNGDYRQVALLMASTIAFYKAHSDFIYILNSGYPDELKISKLQESYDNTKTSYGMVSGIPFVLSKFLSDDLTLKITADNTAFAEKVKSYNELKAKERQEIMALQRKQQEEQRLAEEKREIEQYEQAKAVHEKLLADQENERQQKIREREAWEKEKAEQEARLKQNELKDKLDTLVKSDPEYSILSAECDICDDIRSKRELEHNIGTDNQYVAKYGVINLTQRYDMVQQIRAIEDDMETKKADYKDLTHKAFNAKQCPKLTADVCVKKLETLHKKLEPKYAPQVYGK